ncbi:MAG: ABC transporter ATP-binding protein [Verrucomicrobiota bacterium]
MPAPPPLLELRAVSKSYPSNEGAPPVPVLREASLAIARGESVAIVGPSGSGKTTLLNLLGALDLPDAGEIWLDGQPLHGRPESELARLRNQSIGFVFQSHHLLPHCTVLENVLLPTLASGGRVPAATEARGRELLARVGLAGRLDHLPGRLSGGERQRVAVVRALINQPALLLGDEPTGALDHASAANLADLLTGLNREQGLTLVVVTHSLELAGRLQRVVEVREGRLVETNPARP